jgi:membrane-associated phospholipid phosphatase
VSEPAIGPDGMRASTRRLRGGEGSEREHSLLSYRRRDSIASMVLTVVTLAFFLVMAFRNRFPAIQRMDVRWLHLMVDERNPFLTAVAQLFNVLGLFYVTLPVRIGVAAFLAWRRRWWHFAAFVSAIVVSEILVGTLKNVYDRLRPPQSLALVHTSGASFPSGHAIAASVTTVAIVIALFPDGPRRIWWGVGAFLFSFVMALSRAYLAAHWLTDAIAGSLLGAAVAVDCALVVQEIWDVRLRRSEARRRSSHPRGAGPAEAVQASIEGAGTHGPDG